MGMPTPQRAALHFRGEDSGPGLCHNRIERPPMTNITKAAQDALDRMDALINPANKLLAIPSHSATQLAAFADMATIRAALQDKAGEVTVAIDSLYNERRDGMTNVIFPPVQIGARLFAAHPAPVVPDDVARDAEWFRLIRNGSGWPAVFAAHDAPEPLRGDDLDAAMLAASQQKGGR